MQKAGRSEERGARSGQVQFEEAHSSQLISDYLYCSYICYMSSRYLTVSYLSITELRQLQETRDQRMDERQAEAKSAHELMIDTPHITFHVQPITKRSKILDLSSNKITDREATCLADALRANMTIEELSLLCYRISDVSLKYLTDSLKENRGIRSLCLNGKFRMADLADTLKVNTTLVDVHLHYLNMNNESVKSLADAIVVNRSLNMITWGLFPIIFDRIGVEEWTALMSAVVKNEISKSHKIKIDKKNKEIASLKSERVASSHSLQNEIETAKNKQIISLKSAIRGSMEQFNMILEPIDLTGDAGES
eukprot:scaffold4229_cov38-Cyclotella_meneghiniana.AAC.5